MPRQPPSGILIVSGTAPDPDCLARRLARHESENVSPPYPTLTFIDTLLADGADTPPS